MKPFRAGLGGLQRQGLQAVGPEIEPGGLGFLRLFADALASTDDKEHNMIALSAGGRQNVITQAKTVADLLPLKMKRMQ